MYIGIIITVILALAVLGFATVGLFIGWKRNWLQAVLRTLATVISAVAAWPLTELIVGKASSELYALSVRFLSAPVAYVHLWDKWLDMIPVGNLGGMAYRLLGSLFESFEGTAKSIADFLATVPVGADGILALIGMVLSPILFVALFLLLRVLFGIILMILGASVPYLKKTELRGLALPVGALNGILIVMVLLVPLCGFMTTGAHLMRTATDAHLTDLVDLRKIPVVSSLFSDEVDSSEDAMLDVADALENSPLVWAVHNSIGEPIYNSLTTTTLDVSHTHGQTVEMNLEHEMGCLVRTVGHVMEVKEVFSKDDFDEEDKEILYATADTFFDSDWMKMFATDALVELATSWKANEPVLGMARPTLDANLNPTLNCILDMLSHENGDTLEEDIHVILDVTGDLLASELLSDMGDYQGMIQKLGSTGLLTKMLAKLDANERLHPLGVEIKAMSIRLVTSMLGVDKIQNGEFDEHLGKMAGTLTEVLSIPEEERNEIIVSGVKDALSDQDIDLPDDVVLEVADQMIEDLGEDGEITGEELRQYMIEHADEAFDLGVEIDPDEIPDEIPDGILG